MSRSAPTLRDAVLPCDLDALLALDDAAAAAANAFIYGGDLESRSVRAALAERGVAEWAPPHARLLVDEVPGDPMGHVIGLVALLDAADLTRARVSTALAVRRGAIRISPAVVMRMRIVSGTLIRPASDDAYLSRIAVYPDRAGRGVGRWLLARALDIARAMGAGRLVLDVAGDNVRALAFYRSHGFSEVGRASARDDATGRGIEHVHLAVALC